MRWLAAALLLISCGAPQSSTGSVPPAGVAISIVPDPAVRGQQVDVVIRGLAPGAAMRIFIQRIEDSQFVSGNSQVVADSAGVARAMLAIPDGDGASYQTVVDGPSWHAILPLSVVARAATPSQARPSSTPPPGLVVTIDPDPAVRGDPLTVLLRGVPPGSFVQVFIQRTGDSQTVSGSTQLFSDSTGVLRTSLAVPDGASDSYQVVVAGPDWQTKTSFAAVAPVAESTVSGDVTWIQFGIADRTHGVPDLVVELFRRGNLLSPIASTRTDGSGHYSFSGLRAGNYDIHVPAQSGFVAASAWQFDVDGQTTVDGAHAFNAFPIQLVKPLRVLTPVDGASVSGPFTFTWEAVVVPVPYHYQVLVFDSNRSAVANSDADGVLITTPSGVVIRGVKTTSYAVHALATGHYTWTIRELTDEAYVYTRSGDRSSSFIAESTGSFDIR